MPKAWKSMLEWLEKAHDDPTFGEVQLVLKDDLEDDTEAVDSEAKGGEE